VLLEAAEAALPPEQQAIYKRRDEAARLALDEKLIDNWTLSPASCIVTSWSQRPFGTSAGCCWRLSAFYC
jgi:hypothetical protein